MSESETMENTPDESYCENLTFVITEPDVNFEDVYEEPLPEALEALVTDESVQEDASEPAEDRSPEEPVIEQESVSEEPIPAAPAAPETPLVEESVQEEPVLEQESVSEEPAVEEQIDETVPAAEESVQEEPVLEQESVSEEPAVEEQVPEPVPLVEESVQEEPVIEQESVSEEPAVEEQIDEPVPAAEESVQEELVIEQETISEEPAVEEQIDEPVPVPLVEESVQEEPAVEEQVPEPIATPAEEEPITPKIVFIVPYRNRESHHKMFSSHMKFILQDSSIPYKIFYVHQTDKRGFNRGAMKNIGFLAVKNMYPNDYANITLVFNDIDTMPSKNTVLNYITSPGTIKHFYGFEHTLGGIVSIAAKDFEKLNGFPNFWAWGYEDNLLQIRAEKEGIQIDRSVFYKISDPAIIHLVDTPIREVNRGEYDRFLYRTQEGISSIHDLNYSVDDETGFINVLEFNTSESEVLEKRSDYDLRNGPVPFKAKKPQRRNPSMKMHF